MTAAVSIGGESLMAQAEAGGALSDLNHEVAAALEDFHDAS